MLLAAGLLAGCGGVRLTPGHDPGIVRGLSDYYETTSAFLTRMADRVDREAGRYAANRDFYADGRARLDTLLVRAQAMAPRGSCPGLDLVARLATLLADLGTAADPETLERAERRARAVEGSCTARQIALVRANHDLIEAIHKHSRRLPYPVVRQIKPTLTQSVRIALTPEKAKRRARPTEQNGDIR